MTVIGFIAAALIALTAPPAVAQPLSGPTLVKDINTAASGTGATNVGRGFGMAYFAGNDGATGSELWKSDGTPGGTVLVKDINPGKASSNPTRFTAGTGITFFIAADGEHGQELWRTDGTAAGTMMVKDILPGSNDGPSFDETYGTGMAFVNGLLFFTARAGGNDVEAWRSDGTEAGTFMLKDINPPGAPHPPTGFTALGNLTYFAVSGAIWRTDGTTDGTVLVANVATSIGTPLPILIGELNDNLFFGVATGTGIDLDSALWKTDGTTVGTVQVASFPMHIAPIGFSRTAAIAGDQLLLYARDSSNAHMLWRSDGTNAGTTMIKAFFLQPKYLTAVGNTVYFGGAEAGNVDELWRSDGTLGGTTRVSTLRPNNALVAYGDRLAFTAGFGANTTLYVTDATEPDTTAIASSVSSVPAVVGNTLFFAASDPLHATELWKSDGTVGGTSLVLDIFTGNADSAPAGLAAFGETLLFSATTVAEGTELWRSDGTGVGTQLVRDINPGPASSGAAQLTPAGSRVFFAANEPTAGTEIWITEGTNPSTHIVEDVPTQALLQAPTSLTAVGNRVFYTRAEQPTGEELYVSDGTSEGTGLVKDILPGMGSSIVRNPNYRSQFIAYNGLLFFTATDGQNGIQLWKSDGTEAGTVPVINLPHRIDLYGPRNLIVYNDLLYFTADVNTTPIVGSEIFRSDGTADGTFRPFGAGNPPFPFSELTVANGSLYFPGRLTGGRVQLWKSDGSSPGTMQVKEINPTGLAFGNITNELPQMTAAGDYVFFIANDGTHGFELWRSDGTADGTILLRDIITGVGFHYSLTAFGDLLAFAVAGDGTGSLWISDGTPSGTQPLAGSQGLNPSMMKAVGNRLFMVGLASTGRELYLVSQGGAPTPTASATSTQSLPTATNTPTLTIHPPITASPVSTATPVVVATPTITVQGSTPTATSSRGPTATATTAGGCTGDCNRDGSVTVDEVVRGVNIALGTVDVETCRPFDANGDGQVTVDEIVSAVNNALNGC